MNKFKVGDKVTVKENFWEIESGVGINDTMKKLVGRPLEVRYVDNNGYVNTKQDGSNDDTKWNWDKDWLELYIEPIKEITWETLKWKDVLVNGDGEERMVLGVLNGLVFVSTTNNFDVASHFPFYKQELQNDGYTIKQATPTPETESEAFKSMVAEVKRVSEHQAEKAREARYKEEARETIEVGGKTYKLVK